MSALGEIKWSEGHAGVEGPLHVRDAEEDVSGTRDWSRDQEDVRGSWEAAGDPTPAREQAGL